MMAPCSQFTCFGSTTARIATVLLICFGSFTSFGFASLHDNNSNAGRSVLESHHHSRRLGCVCDAECDRIQEEDCVWGLTLDVCGCCLVCSRGEGEPCGGALGSCSHQLYCVAGPAGAPSSDGGEEEDEGRTCSAQAPPTSDCKDDEGERFGCYFSGGNCLCRNFSSCHELDYFLFDTQDACHSRIELLTANSGGHALIDRERDKTGEDGHGGGCSRVKCPQALDCPSDSYRLPTNFHPDSDECCPAVNKCQCNPVIECPKPECPPDWTSQLVLNATGEPGRCCPILECNPKKSLGTKQRCNYLGTQYNQGDSWTHLEDCTECSCTGNGVVSCQRIKCDLPAQCLMARAPPGSCCPVCAGCTTSEGKVYNNSDIWEEDACTLCECDEGRVKCHATMCQSQCENPIYLPEECCPRCVESAEDGVMVKDCGEEEMVNCNKNCPYGFVRNEKVCPHCECNKCPPHSPCHLKCPEGYEMDELGCPICSCRWSRSEVSDRGRPPQWMTENNNKNRDKKRAKTRVNKASLRSGSPNNKVNTFVGKGVGGKTCKWTDGRDEIVRLDGEEWSDGCRECVCKFGREFCTLISCSPPECEHPIFYPGGCCPRCPDEEWDHVHSNVTICPGSGSNKPAHLEGEQWELTPCLKCTCHRGLTLCATQTCPPAPCQTSDLETPAIGSCCPKCKPGLVNKEPESNIMQARVSEMRSVPLRGTLKVDVGGRRTTAVMSTLRKNCFSDDLQLKYADGEAWKVGPCQSCICQDGRIECFSSSGNCPRLDCQRPALAKNQCCPMCLDDADGKVRAEMNCSSVSGSGTNDTWLHGQSWMADKCTRCVCNAPLVQCTRIICSISCRKPLLYVEDECCPICPPDEDQLLKGHGILEPYCTVIIVVLFCLTTLLGLYVLTSIYQQRRGRQRLSSSSFNSKPSSSSASSCSSEDDSGYYKAATTSCCRKTKNKYVPAATSASQVSRSSSNNSCHRHHGHQECSGGENCGETEEKLLCPNNV